MSVPPGIRVLLDDLSDDELLAVHREVSRRAAPIYEHRYRALRERNFHAAMSRADTRFQPGLSALENWTRSHALRAHRSPSR